MEEIVRYGLPVYPFSFDVTTPDENGFFIVRIINESEQPTAPLTELTVGLNETPPDGVGPIEVFVRDADGFEAAGVLDGQSTTFSDLPEVPVDPGAIIFEIFATVVLAASVTEFFDEFPGGSVEMTLGNGFDTTEFFSELNVPILGGPGSDSIEFSGIYSVSDFSSNSVFSGGSFIDTLAFSGPRESLRVEIPVEPAPNLVEIFTGESAFLPQVDVITFEDGGDALDLNALSGVLGMSAEQWEWFAELYAASFDALPTGEAFLTQATRYAGLEPEAMARALFDEVQLALTYDADLSEDSPTDFVTSVYRVLLGREPDVPGLEYWVAELTARSDGTEPRDVELFLMDFISGTRLNPASAADRALLSNKTDAVLLTGPKLGFAESELVQVIGSDQLSDIDLAGPGAFDAFLDRIVDGYRAANAPDSEVNDLNVRFGYDGEGFRDPAPRLDLSSSLDMF